ncbi:MAG: hypothetical protein LBR46_00015 [Prevotella sp.]|jgi:hypothetical protein|nr:hypothetical protein [Prevotella sp.]
MKFAIDRIRIGTEEEVSADEYYDLYIPQRKTRFFCPECGEPVFWRCRGGAQPNKFCHYTKMASSPECDKRVDGRSELNLYERVGLPMSLIRLGESNFRINIMFPAIGERLLEIASRQNLKICISGYGKDRIFPINHTYFREDATTMLPVDFVPQWGSNYAIQVDTGYEIKRRWSNYSDGFAQGGAIFTYEETGGKKIRRGDSISPGRLYYIVTKQFHSPYSEIKTERIGSIRLNECDYSVYTALVNVSIDDEIRFTVISNYLKSQFGVLLLETAPELIVLWPPVTEQDVLVPTKNTSVIYCAVSSGNTVPKVYSYNSNIVSSLDVSQDGNGVNALVLPIHKHETVVSVDRKYIGREIIFRNKLLTIEDYAYKIAMEKQDGTALDFEALTSTDLSSDLVLKSNAKMELYIGSHDKTYLHVPIRSSYTTIPVRRNPAEIIFAVENGILQQYGTNTIQEPSINEQNLLRLINENCMGEYIPAPRWIGFLLSEWQRNGHSTLAFAVRRYIYNGKIPRGLLNTLQVSVKMQG